MFKKAMVSLLAVASMVCAYAEPVTITQTFSDVAYNDFWGHGGTNSVTHGQSPTGDWIFRGTVDSNAVNISLWSDIGAYQLTSLTLTQASLGLFEATILNAPILLFYPNFFAFTLNIYGGSPWTEIVYENDHFASAHTLQDYLALIMAPSVNESFSGFGPQWEGFEFEDGRRLYGSGAGVGAPAVLSNAVPEPTSLLLWFSAVAALLLSTRCVTFRKRGICEPAA